MQVMYSSTSVVPINPPANVTKMKAVNQNEPPKMARDGMRMGALRYNFLSVSGSEFLEYILSTLLWYQHQDQLYYTDNCMGTTTQFYLQSNILLQNEPLINAVNQNEQPINAVNKNYGSPKVCVNKYYCAVIKYLKILDLAMLVSKSFC